MNWPTCGKDNPEDAQFGGICGVSLIVSTASGIGTAAAELPKVSFPRAVKLGFKNYFKFGGRATMDEFWWFILFLALLQLLTWIPLIGQVIWLVGIIPRVSVTSRRLHDIGKSGLWQLQFWVPVTVVILSLGLFFGLMGRYFQEVPPVWVESLALGSVFMAGIAAIVATSFLIIWLTRKCDEGSNKYGPDPRQVIAQQPYKP